MGSIRIKVEDEVFYRQQRGGRCVENSGSVCYILK